MQKRLIINLALTLLLAILVLLSWFKPGINVEKPTLLTHLSLEEITQITIKPNNAKTITLVKINDNWRLTQPISAPALPGKVERLLKISQIKTQANYPLDKDNLSQFGLDKPRLTLQFDHVELQLGKTSTVDFYRYISNGKQLLLVDDTFIHLLNKQYNDYIDTRLLADNIQIIGLSTPSLDLVKKEDNSWEDLTNINKEISSDTVHILLDEWRFARAIRVKAHSTLTPTQWITLKLSDGATLTYGLTKNKHDIILSSTEQQLDYYFSADKFTKMTQRPQNNL